MKVDTPWFGRIRDKKQLSVFADRTVSKGPWARMLPKAIQEFNTLSGSLKLGMTLQATSDKPAPGENDFGGADIWFAAGGKFTFETSGEKTEVSLISTTATEGRCNTLAWDFGHGAQIRKALILVPPTPRAQTRLAGDPVLLVIAVHEFIHALGLGSHATGDLFEGVQQLRAGAPNKPGDDRVEVGTKLLPPLFLSPATIGRINLLWPTP
jgi:hypothetical protein